MSHRSSFSSTFSRVLRYGLALFCLVLLAPLVPAQSASDETEVNLQPIFVTTRVFQLAARRGTYRELNEQVFKLSTASLNDHNQWLKQLQKTYPGFDIALLRTEIKRVFRTSKPASVSFVHQPDGRHIELQMFGAQSYGDGVKPGTTLIPELTLRFSGNQDINKPLAFAIQPLEIAHGMTYFFTPPNLRLNSGDYIKFVRPNAPPTSFEGQEVFLVFAFSIELDKAATPARLFNDRQSTQLQESAIKKVQPELPAVLRQAGLYGAVRVQVEIAPTGKVTSANIHTSNFPEMNVAVLAATRQWEFPTSHFAEDKNPITAFLNFNFPPPSSSAGKQ